MAKKYRLQPDAEGLYRLIAARDFKASRKNNLTVKKGDRGGLVAGPYNLSQGGNCWVEEGARVLDQAKVNKDALVLDQATVSGRAVITDHSWVGGSAQVRDNAQVLEGGAVTGSAVVRDGATVRSSGIVGGSAVIEHRARVEKGATVGDRTVVGGIGVVRGEKTIVVGDSHIIKGVLEMDALQ